MLGAKFDQPDLGPESGSQGACLDDIPFVCHDFDCGANFRGRDAIRRIMRRDLES